MKIERQRVNGATVAGRTRRPDAKGDETFRLDDAGPAPAPAGLTGLAGTSALGAVLLAQQEEFGERRRQNFSRAADLLDRLDEIRMALLTGRLQRTTLEKLASALATQRQEENDPAVTETLDAIDLRVAVELAKYHN